jgi:NADH:ubiquinone oxidoreductase subunit K
MKVVKYLFLLVSVVLFILGIWGIIDSYNFNCGAETGTCELANPIPLRVVSVCIITLGLSGLIFTYFKYLRRK